MTNIINDILPGEWMEGIVVGGKGRGKKLGFPTINLLTEKINFPFGIYICWIRYKNYEIYKGLLFYGSRLTFAETDPSLEILLLQFVPQTKLGQKIQFKLMKYLREVKKFSSAKELIKQIKKDLQAI